MIHARRARVGLHLRESCVQVRQSVALVTQTEPFASFDPSFEGGQHPWRPDCRFDPRPSRPIRLAGGVRLSNLFSPFRHCHWFVFHWSVRHVSTFLCSLRSTPVTEFHRYYGHCGLLCGWLFAGEADEHQLVTRTGLPDSRAWPSGSFRLHTPDRPRSSLSHATPQRDRFPAAAGRGFAIDWQARRSTRPYRVRHPTD